MTFREWNNRKNNYLREQKGKWAAKLLGCAPRSDAYHPQKVHKILLLRNDNKLGDALVSSVLLRGLKVLFPTADIDVVAGKSNALILRNNPAVSTLYFATERFVSLMSCGLKLRGKQYDLYLDLDEKPTLASLTFLKFLQPRWAFGFNRKKYPLYNLMQPLDLSSCHITARYEACLRYLGYQGGLDTSYEIQVPETAKAAAQRFLSTLRGGGRLIVVNPLAASRHRSFSAEQIFGLAAAFPKDTFVLLGQEPKLRKWLNGRALLPRMLVFTAGVFEAAALAQQASVLLTPDTFWVHLACALHIPTVAVYRGKEEFPYKGNIAIWRPLEASVKMVLCESEQHEMPVPLLVQALQEKLK
ncbi:glycosyltransferase family 9 protein [Candidatus Avelusimicrobium stercoris]|uniref:glycosyltransferase family 9 protein n=1 Tax=Candidatus Avelusimicrobium stercoris TaxID=1947924 RepID=UPI003D126349